MRKHIPPLNLNVQAAHLTELSHSASSKVRSQVAENPNVTAEILLDLVRDPESSVRYSAIDNPQLTEKELQILERDVDPDIRYRLASDSHVPTHILNHLTQDQNPYVCSRAKRTLHRLLSDTEKSFKRAQIEIPLPGHTMAMPAWIEDLFEDELLDRKSD